MRRPAELSASGIEATVADARFAKPIDAGLMAQLAAEHDLLVTVEEGVLGGWLRQRGVGDPERDRRHARGSCGWACPTAM